MTLLICFIYETVLFETKLNRALVLKFDDDVMMWFTERDYSAINRAWNNLRRFNYTAFSC